MASGALKLKPIKRPKQTLTNRRTNQGMLAVSVFLSLVCCTELSLKAEFAASFGNPILAGGYADPPLVKVGNDFFMTHSSFRYAPGYLMWRSRDLIHWTPVTHALQRYYGDVWAPDLLYQKGRFCIYYRCSYGLFVISALHIEGPWSPPVHLQVTAELIEPGFVAGRDGKGYPYLSGGNVVGFTEDGLSVVGDPRKVYAGWPIPAEWRVECPCLESPKLLYQDGWSHLSSAEGGTGGPSTSHMVVEVWSRDPLGAWEHSPYNPAIHTWPRTEKWWSSGHGTVFQDGASQWWVHCVRFTIH